MRAVKLVLFNQIVVGGAVTLVMHPVYVWRGCSFGPELPSFHWVLFEIAIFTLVEEVGFYYSHRYVSLKNIESQRTAREITSLRHVKIPLIPKAMLDLWNYVM